MTIEFDNNEVQFMLLVLSQLSVKPTEKDAMAVVQTVASIMGKLTSPDK